MGHITPQDIEDVHQRGESPENIAMAEEYLRSVPRLERLADLVTTAFAGVTLEDGIGLREANGIDDYASDEKLRELRLLDEKTDWTRIPLELLRHCHAAPSFLDAKGMRFHMPAFLVAELRGEDLGGFISRLIGHSFTAPEFVKLLSPEQRHAIIAVLSCLGSLKVYECELPNIARAIARYS
jgi:hypothetical protein